MSASSAMRVAIVGTNDPRNFSGGRYHGLIMAYAVAAFGGDVHVITDHKPAFVRDLEPLAPGRVVFHQTRDFVGGLPDGGFDWVFVIPTGIFLPNFYECCLDFAAQSGARLGLVNFESGNWFNALAPEPRDARLWDYWRRICLGGALLLSSARTSDQWARAFYHAPDGHLRFEVWYPPINSEAARRFEGVKKDGSLLAFVRPQDAHKGSGMLTELDPALYAGRTLRLISGRDLPKEFTAAISDHLRRTSDARLEVCLRVSDIHKYRLLSCAQAVLFPTHFEGYGYPPIEAAYAGTESACFDLPVLKETVGSIAHFAPQPTLAGFEAAVAAALAMPERRQELRAAINTIADFQVASTRLAEILTRSADSVAPVAQRRFWIAVGPFARTPPLPSEKVDRAAPLPTFPPYVVSATHTTAGEVVITCRAQLPASVERLEATDAGGTVLLPSTWDAGPANATGLRDFRIYLVAPKEIIGHRLMIQGYRDNQSAGKAIELEVERVAPASRLLPVIAGISENDVEQDQRKLRGWVLAREPVTTLCFTARGKTWLRFPVGGERRDVFAKNPGYPSPRCEFSVRVPLDEEPHRADSRLICLAGPPGQEQAIDTLASWPPAPKPYFTESVTLSPPPGPVAPAPGAVVAAKARPAGTTEPKPRRPQFGSL
ncbi:MAG: glycosyltransferase [Rhodospirillales bacterium]|nr:glycosyltransferase [Rhodospirillales bacterium]